MARRDPRAPTMADLAPPAPEPGTPEYEDWLAANGAIERTPTLPPSEPPAPTPTADPPVTDRAPDTLYGTTPYTDRGSGTGAADWQYGGFDFAQDPNNRLIGKSAKYTLADATRIAKEAGATDTWKTKEGAGDFAKQWIQPYLEKHGFEVLEVVGDKMRVRDHADRAAGREGSWIDWVANAGGANPNIAFQVEQSQSAFGAPETYVPKGFTPTRGGPTGTPLPGAPTALPQTQDRYGRPPGHPNYGLPPQPGETGLVDTRAAINPNAYTPLAPSMNGLGYPELI